MKVLFLILASDDGESGYYTQFQKEWMKYMNINPNIECYFYKSTKTNNNEFYELSGNTLMINQGENWNSIFDKTVKALKFFQPRFSEFDWICRPNLSSFYHFDKYLDYLKSIPDNIKIEGVPTYHNIEYPSGCGFSIKPEIASLIIENNQNQYIMDDVTFGLIYINNNISFYKRNKLYCIDKNNIDEYLTNVNSSPIFHYRFRTQSRADDIENISKFINTVYNI